MLSRKSLMTWGVACLVTFSGLAESRVRSDVKLSDDACLKSRPGESAPTIVKLREGQPVQVLERRGRWLRITTDGKVGWITRTQVASRPVSLARPASSPRKRDGWNAPRRDTVVSGMSRLAPKSGDEWQKGMNATVRSPAAIRQRPSTKSAELYEVSRGEKLKIVLLDEEGGKWARVQDETGARGWVETSALSPLEDTLPVVPTGRHENPGSDARHGSKVHAGDEENAARFTYGAVAGLGVLARTQSLASNGTGIRANYGLSYSNPAVMVSGNLGTKLGRVELGMQVAFLKAAGGPGIRVEGQNDSAGNLDVQGSELCASTMVGTWVGGKIISIRVGYRRQFTTIERSQVALLPSETTSGIIFGSSLHAPRLGKRLGARLGVDAMLSGSLEQSAGMRDGAASSLRMFSLGAEGTYRLGRSLAAFMSYGLDYEKARFSGASDRETTALGGTRTAFRHVMGAGMSVQF
ncbi:MAG: SH3 domain-containing protein [Deltaproteobacteria bacterium]|nr:SH3 domain-containing protein [Deltaproteobacteria bacterium]